MTEFHEIKIINTQKNYMIDIIYIHDDFFGYLGEAHPRQIELLNNLPVFYPDNIDFNHLSVQDFKFLKKFHTKKATEKGISLAGISIINGCSFEELLDISKQLIIAENSVDYTPNKFVNTFTKDETKSNLEKLSTILSNISLHKTEYILLWEGI